MVGPPQTIHSLHLAPQRMNPPLGHLLIHPPTIKNHIPHMVKLSQRLTTHATLDLRMMHRPPPQRQRLLRMEAHIMHLLQQRQQQPHMAERWRRLIQDNPKLQQRGPLAMRTDQGTRKDRRVHRKGVRREILGYVRLLGEIDL